MRTHRSLVMALVVAAGALVGTLSGLWLWREFAEPRGNSAADELVAALKGSEFKRQRKAVQKYLYDPGSAEYRNVRQSTVRPEYWCGEVNAKNLMGGRSGFTRYVVELYRDAAGLETSDETLSIFDTAHVERPSQLEKTVEDVKFLAYWNGYCKPQ